MPVPFLFCLSLWWLGESISSSAYCKSPCKKDSKIRIVYEAIRSEFDQRDTGGRVPVRLCEFEKKILSKKSKSFGSLPMTGLHERIPNLFQNIVSFITASDMSWWNLRTLPCSHSSSQMQRLLSKVTIWLDTQNVCCVKLQLRRPIRAISGKNGAYKSS